MVKSACFGLWNKPYDIVDFWDIFCIMVRYCTVAGNVEHRIDKNILAGNADYYISGNGYGMS